MPSDQIILLAFAAAAVIDWIAVAQERRELEWIAKPAALALLLLWAATGPATSWAVLAALAFSLLGDVYLMLPGNFFVAGLAAFLVGHLFYIDAFTAPLVWRAVWSVVVLAASAPIGLRIVREAGGVVSDFGGGAHDVFGTETLASNGRLHDAMLAVLAAHR